jgi:hypothetical protein
MKQFKDEDEKKKERSEEALEKLREMGADVSNVKIT